MGLLKDFFRTLKIHTCLNIFKNFALMKIFFALFTSFLLYNELITFWIEKPTYTSSSKVKIAPHDFPDITICPFPSWNLQEMLKLGYGQSFEYSKGHIANTPMTGWSGNTTENTPESVIEKISILKNHTECPFTRAKMITEGKAKFIPLEFVLTSLYHPSGRCCKVLNYAYIWKIGFKQDLQLIGTYPTLLQNEPFNKNCVQRSGILHIIMNPF